MSTRNAGGVIAATVQRAWRCALFRPPFLKGDTGGFLPHSCEDRNPICFGGTGFPACLFDGQDARPTRSGPGSTLPRFRVLSMDFLCGLCALCGDDEYICRVLVSCPYDCHGRIIDRA